MDLDIVRVLRSIPPEHEPAELKQLTTVFGESLNTANPLPEHPRPHLAREHWTSLNGPWEYAIVSSSSAERAWRTAEPPQTFDGPIVVPFSPEASLSSVGRQLQPTELLWYRRSFEAKPTRGRTLLHLDGVDWACSVYLNGKKVGDHIGAYLPFTFDITQDLLAGTNELAVCVFDPSETGGQLRGKQRLDRGDMWYTAQSGIWKSVWLEQVPSVYLQDVRLTADADANKLLVTAWFGGLAQDEAGPRLGVAVYDAVNVLVGTGEVHPAQGVGVAAFSIDINDPHLWSPEDPYLYRVNVSFGADSATSYCAFRTVSVEPDSSGTPRFCLNHQPYFLRGLLDQGYWPDGLLTPPSDEAMVFDITTAKEAGFNLLRKHIKVESERWYYHCDRLGMLVMQDMPSGGAELSKWHTRDKPTLFKHSWNRMRDDTPANREKLAAGSASYRQEWAQACREIVVRLLEHPCIIGWVLFNESWGQFSAAHATELVRRLDGSRPILSVSGWYDQGCGDIMGIHNYFRKMHLFPDRFAKKNGPRAQMLNEFGGLTFRVEGHSCLDRVYGYDAYEDLDAWRAGLNELLSSVDALEAKGLSGFVYTQISDVEEETNGLMTYDRKVNKLNG